MGPKTLQQAKEALVGDFDNWQGNILAAYESQGMSITIAFQLKIDGMADGKTKIEHSINFIESRVKDKDTIVVDEKQEMLPGM